MSRIQTTLQKNGHSVKNRYYTCSDKISRFGAMLFFFNFDMVMERIQ